MDIYLLHEYYCNILKLRRQKLINTIAHELSFQGYKYEESILKMQEIGMFSNWDIWELKNRPIDIEEIKEMLA